MLRARKTAGRAGALLMAAALTAQLILPVGAVGTDGGTKNEYPDYYTPYMIEALEQGDDIKDDAYTHNNDTLFTASMVHNNPGLEPYTSKYNDSQFLADRNIDEQVFFLYDCAQYGLLWDEYDRDQGITLTEEEWKTNPEETKEQNDKKVFPYGSEARAWVEAKRADLKAKYAAADKAGVDVYFMMDIIVLPAHLKEMRKADLCKENSDNINISKTETQEVMDYMFKEMFETFPTIDGIYIRYGETYTGTKYGDAAPYHTGNSPIDKKAEEKSHLDLINYMSEKLFGSKMVDTTPRDVIYRTWGFGGFQNTPKDYLRVCNKIEPNKHLYLCIKHSTGDFHRDVAFNQTIGIGTHQQIVEVQCAREYEGKGAYPNYLIHGVINGMEEYEWLNPDDTYQSLRDVINSKEDPQVKGVWIWPRGGGWNGPYINGVNGIRDDNPYYPPDVEPRLSNPQVDIPDGSEMWNDLNSYVVTQWAKDTSKTDKYYVKEYAKQYLGMDADDAEAFYRLCILSEHAVLLGRGTNDPDVKSKCNDTWWTRDQNINSGKLTNNVNKAVKNNLQDIVLREKAQCVAMWEEMLEIAQSFKTDAKLIDSPTVGVKDYIITTCKYGYYFFDITQQMYIAGIKKAEGDRTGVYDVEAIRGAVAEYDRLWREWQELYETAAGCPTLFEKEDRANNLIGYKSNRGTDAFMKSYRETLSMDSTFQIGKGQTAKLPVRYNYFNLSALSYESSDPDVAAVNGDGTVTGVAAGKCMVTVRAGEGVSASAMVVVGENSSIEDVRFENDFVEDNTASWGGTNGTITWKDGAIQVSNGADANGRTLGLNGPHTGKFIVSWKMKVNNTTNRAYMRLKDSTGLNLAQVEFRGGEKNNYKIVVYNDSKTIVNVTGGDYKADTWYDVKVDVDTNAHTYTVTIGSDSVSFSNFKDSDVADVSQIEVVARTSDVTISVDDVRVAVVPEVKITAQEIADAIHTARMRTDKDALLMPAVPDGYTISVKSAAPDGIVNGDGSVAPPDEDTTVNVIFQVTNVEDPSDTADTVSIAVEIPAADKKKIKSVSPLENVSVLEGTTTDEMIHLLPVSVEVTLDDNSKTMLKVSDWTYDNTNDTNVGYAFLGELELPEHITNTNGLTARIIVELVALPTEDTNIEAIEALDPITVPYGTAKKDLPLPGGVAVTLERDLTLTLPVDGWSCYSYDPDTSAEYIFTATLTLPEHITNTKDLKATILVTVEEKIAVTGVTLNETSLGLYSNRAPGTARLTAAVAPADATDKTVTWSSDNTAVATVDENGLVTAVGNGTAVITVTTKDGGHTARCTVTVTTYTSGGGSSSGSGSSSSSGTTTKTEKNPDGSTTTTVTDKKTGTVTETTKWPDGTEKKVETRKDGSVTTTTTEPNGKKVEKAVTAEKDVTITVTDPAGETVAKVKLPAQIPEGETKFADVPQGHWAEKAIDTVAGLGLVKGVGENRYDMTSPMTRGSLATILYRLSNGKAAEDIRFADVETGEWYTEGISWAAKHGIVQGVGEDLFKPKDVISREQLAVMLCRYAKVLGMDVESSSKSLESFSDGDRTGEWAVDGVAWCVEKGILQGKGGDVLDPGADVSRAEVAVMLQRFVELMR